MVARGALKPKHFVIKGQVGPRALKVLIRAQEVISARGPYAYLEVGSYLGRSLQSHLQDPDCRLAVSIDLRPDVTPDERGALSMYRHISADDMVRGLREVCTDPEMAKLETVTDTSDALRRRTDGTRFDLALIDGEHTIAAAFRDFLNVRSVMGASGLICFDDCHIVYPALINAAAFLEDQGTPHELVFCQAGIGVLAIGPEARDLAGGFRGRLEIGREAADAAYRENLIDHHIQRNLARKLAENPSLRAAAVEALRSAGCGVTDPAA